MATAAARSPSPGQARPCCAMRRSADSSPFKPADCPQRSASSVSKGGGVCGCHASPRRRSFGEKENEQQQQQRDAAARTPAKAARPFGSKNFMSPTISATSKAVAASPSPRKRVLGERNEETHLLRVLGERNEETHLFAPFSPANLAHKPKGPPPEAGSASARRLRLSFDGPAPAAAHEHGSQRRSFGEEHERMENHHHAAADSVDAEPSRAALYDPKANYTSPRPQYLLFDPTNSRIKMYRHAGSGARRLEERLASESSEESVTTTTDDDLTEEEQEQAPEKPEEPSALPAPSEAGDAAATPAAVSFFVPLEPAPASPRAPVLTLEPAPSPRAVSFFVPLEPAPSSPRAPVLTLEPAPSPRAAVSFFVPLEPAPASPRTPVVTSEQPAVTSPPAQVLATEPWATSPRTHALTPEPELGVTSKRAPAKKRSSLRFMFPVALILFMAAAFVYVSPPDSPVMSNPALSKVSNFLSVQELHPVELAAWLKQWSSSSLDSITSYWEAFASTKEQEYFGPHFAANLSAAPADADHGADFYYNFAEAWSVPSEDPVGASFFEEQLNIQDVISASNTDLSAQAESDVVVGEESIDAAVGEEADASDSYKVAEELDLEISEEAPENYGEEEMTSFSQDLDVPSEPTGELEQDVEIDESEDDHTSSNEGQEEYRGLKSDSSMWPSYLDKISKPAATAVAFIVVLLSVGVAVYSMRKTQTQVPSNASAPAEEPEQAENQSVEDHHLVKPSQSVSGSSEGHLVKPSQFQSSMAEETERFGDSAFSQYSSSLSSGQGRRRRTKEEESLGLEPTRRDSTAQSTSSYGSFTTYEKLPAKKKNKEDEAMTPVRRSSRLRTVKTPEA